MKKLIPLAVAAVLVIGLAIAGFAWLNTPKNVALRSVKAFAENAIEREEISTIVKTMTGGSIDASLESIVENSDGDSEDLFENSSISGKIYFSKNAMMLNNFDAEIYGTKIAGSAYVSKDSLYIDENHILNDTYGVQLSTLIKELEDSIFAPNSNSDYEIDEETFDKIISALENVEKIEKIEKDAKKLLKNTLKDVLEIVLDNAEITSSNAFIRTNGTKNKVRQITITIDSDAMQNILNDVYDYLCNSDDIVDFMNDYEDTIILMIDDLYDPDEYDSLEEAYKDWLDEIEDDIEDMCDSIDEDFEDISIKIATSKASVKLVKLNVEMGKENILVLDCGKDGIKKTDCINIEFADELNISYTVTVSNRKSFKAKLIIEIENDGELELTLDINKAKGNYTLTSLEKDSFSDDYSDKYTVKGSYAQKGDTVTFSIDTIDNKYTSSSGTTSDWSYEIDCKITIDTKDRMPKPIKDYKGLSDITESDLEKWIEELEDID